MFIIRPSQKNHAQAQKLEHAATIMSRFFFSLSIETTKKKIKVKKTLRDVRSKERESNLKGTKFNVTHRADLYDSSDTSRSFY